MGVRDWFKRRRRKDEKEGTPESEKLMEPAAEEKEELPPEPPSQEAEEPSTSAGEEAREQAPEALTEEAEESTSEPLGEETKELPTQVTEKLSPETATPEGQEPTSEPVKAEEQKEVVPEPAPEIGAENVEEVVKEQPPSEKVEKPQIPSMWKLAFRGLRRKPKRKEKETIEKIGKKAKKEKKEKEGSPEPEFFKYLILPITLASMLLGLSIMPLFPQPLPAILAFLIAFVTYKKPRIGMPIGGLTVGLGLMYNLAQMNFISMLGLPEMRAAFVFVLLFVFTAFPVIFHSRRAVISINLGIIAAILLFFSQTYFLAIPLIFTAVALFKRISFLTVVYYTFISVPLQIMQYLNLVLPIERWDWWIEPGTSPPIYVPLTEIFTKVQESMLQFRLYK